MQNVSDETVSADFGFELLERKRALKTQLDKRGTAGLISLVKALVWSGVQTRPEIEARVEGITGDHVEATLDQVLTWGADLHWQSHADEGYFTPVV